MSRRRKSERPESSRSVIYLGSTRPEPSIAMPSINSNEHVRIAWEDGAQPRRTLDTFSGVFSPVALSMFSAVIFIRLGYIVGNAGLLSTLLQFAIAYAILYATVTSVCALATNGSIQGGGAYFMISRALGPEFGGSIGTLFFLANVFSSALCISGCTESLLDFFRSNRDDVEPNASTHFYYAALLNFVTMLLSLIGAKMFASASVIILSVVVVCLSSVFVSFFTTESFYVPLPIDNTVYNASNVTLYTSFNLTTFTSNLFPHYARDYTSPTGTITNFATVFSVLFSGVTGIMAGANMSGELRQPSKAIPSGTLSAVTFTLIVYVALSVFTSFTCTPAFLQNNYVYLRPINVWQPFIAIGTFTATFFAGLSNLIGGSRVLEALASDQIYGNALKSIQRLTFSGNPVGAVAVTWLLVQLVLFAGSLNSIAKVNSILFLLSYFGVNLACVMLLLTSAPNFRPTFTYFNVPTSVFGLIGCVSMMIIINPVIGVLSILLCVFLVIVLHVLFSDETNDKTSTWGSISQALYFHQVRKYLLLLDSRKSHVKYWRPQILHMVSSPRTACPLIDFINDLKKSGLYVIGHVDVGECNRHVDKPVPDATLSACGNWQRLVDHLSVKAFVELTIAPSVYDGYKHLVRMAGMGAMKPNTVFLGFLDDKLTPDFIDGPFSHYRTSVFARDDIFKREGRALPTSEYVSLIVEALCMQKNICVGRHFSFYDRKALERNSNLLYIDVWTMNVFEPTLDADEYELDETCLFMLQLAVIINMVDKWKRLTIRVFVTNPTPSIVTQLKKFRIDAQVFRIPRKHALRKCLSSGYIDYARLTHEMNVAMASCNHVTAVTFCYMPRPPAMQSPRLQEYLGGDLQQANVNYWRLMTHLTHGLRPVVLVHALNRVISTTL